MAVNWTICRETLFDDPRTITVGVATNLDPDHVVGKLLRVWLWAGKHTANGFIPGANLDGIDRVCAHKTFGSAMVSVGWIKEEDGGLRMSQWKKHNAKCWKQRERERKKKRVQRQNVPGDIPRDIPRDKLPYSKSNSKEQAVKDIAKCSNAAAGAALGTDACSLLAGVGLDPGAIRHLLARGGVDDCLVEWACGRLRDEVSKERRGGKVIGNPPGFVRALIEAGKVPRGWRDAWTKRRLAVSAAALKNNGVLGRVGATA